MPILREICTYLGNGNRRLAKTTVPFEQEPLPFGVLTALTVLKLTEVAKESVDPGVR